MEPARPSSTGLPHGQQKEKKIIKKAKQQQDR
jgi:hypothetical protein